MHPCIIQDSAATAVETLNLKSKVCAPDVTTVEAEIALSIAKAVEDAILLIKLPAVQTAVVLDAVKLNSTCHCVVCAADANTVGVIATN